jgi:hypothetical protein
VNASARPQEQSLAGGELRPADQPAQPRERTEGEPDLVRERRPARAIERAQPAPVAAP